MIARIWCRVFGHKRGKRVPDADGVMTNVLRCPRCMQCWRRKPRRKADISLVEKKRRA